MRNSAFGSALTTALGWWMPGCSAFSDLQVATDAGTDSNSARPFDSSPGTSHPSELEAGPASEPDGFSGDGSAPLGRAEAGLYDGGFPGNDSAADAIADVASPACPGGGNLRAVPFELFPAAQLITVLSLDIQGTLSRADGEQTGVPFGCVRFQREEGGEGGVEATGGLFAFFDNNQPYDARSRHMVGLRLRVSGARVPIIQVNISDGVRSYCNRPETPESTHDLFFDRDFISGCAKPIPEDYAPDATRLMYYSIQGHGGGEEGPFDFCLDDFSALVCEP